MELSREIWEFTRTDLARLFRSGKGLVLLVLYGLIEAAGGVIFALVSKSAAGQLMSTGLLAVVASGGDHAMQEHLQQIPVPILFAYWFTLFVMPPLVLLMGFDQISGELSTRSVRYLASRSRRVSWALGKALAQVIALFGLSLAANAVVLIFSLATVPGIAFAPALGWLLALWLLSLIYGAAYVGLVTLISSLFRTPFLALAAGAVALVVLGTAGLMARWIEQIHFVSYALPGSYASGLISPDVAVAAGSAAALLGFAAVFLGGAVGVLKARDL
jgi:ABC-type transport system involved in multi-copper enzyme maturation permease subunit